MNITENQFYTAEKWGIDSFLFPPFLGITDRKCRYKNNETIKLTFYVCDFNQNNVRYNNIDTFTLFYFLNGRYYSEILVSGYNVVTLPAVPIGNYDMLMYARDKKGICSYLQTIPLKVESSSELQDSEIYTMTAGDLTTYGIDNTGNTSETVITGNIIGLNNLFNDKKGYKKIIMLNGTYMLKTYFDREHPIIIPSNFTVDLNGAKIKQAYAGRCEGVGPGLMVKLGNTESHIINGTIEGEYDEHIDHMEAPAKNVFEGEALNSIYLGYSYCSLENVNIGYSTGYNTCIRNLNLKYSNVLSFNAEYIDNSGNTTSDVLYSSTDFIDITILKNQISDVNYGITANYYAGYSKITGDSLIVKYIYFDANRNIIRIIKGKQFRYQPIPDDAVYLRIVFYTPKGTLTTTDNVRLITGRINYCNEIKNVSYYDTRTCAIASGSFDNLYIENCTFARSGQSCTPVPIDIEDGSKWAMNLYFKGNKITEKAATQTGGAIICYGENIVYDGNLNFDLETRGIKGLFVSSENAFNFSYVNREEFISGILELKDVAFNRLKILYNYSVDSYSYSNSVIENTDITGSVLVPTTERSVLFYKCNFSTNASFQLLNTFDAYDCIFKNFSPSNLTGSFRFTNCEFTGNTFINNVDKEKGKNIFFGCHFENLVLKINTNKNIFIGCTFDNIKINSLSSRIKTYNLILKRCNITYTDILVDYGPYAYSINATDILIKDCIINNSNSKGLLYMKCADIKGKIKFENNTINKAAGYLIELNSANSYTNTNFEIINCPDGIEKISASNSNFIFN